MKLLNSVIFISFLLAILSAPVVASGQKPGAVPSPPPPPTAPAVAPEAPPPAEQPTVAPETPPAPAADPAQKIIDVLFTSDHYGRFFTPDCVGKKPTSFLMAMARKIEELAPTFLPAGAKPLFLGGGNLFSPDALGQYLLEKEDGAKFILSMFQKMGMKATAYGPEDLLSPPEVFERASSVFTTGGISLLATNIECQKAQEAKCRERVARHLVFEHDGVKIGVLALFPVAHNSRLPKGVAEMIKFTDPVKAYKEARAQLEKEGVQLVFLVSHLDTEMTFPGAVLGFLRGLDVPEPAVVFASQAQNPSVQKMGYVPLIKRNHGALIVGSSRFGRSFTQLRLALKPAEKGGFTVDASASDAMDVLVSPEPLEAGAPALALVDGFCEEFSKPLGNNVIEKPMELESFLVYVLGVMRATERTELAVINRDILNQYDFPVSGQVTKEMIARMVRFDSSMVVLHLKGKDVKSLFGAFADSNTAGLKILGLEKGKINNRDIEDDLHYAVVTTQYVASGGGGFIPAQADLKESEHSVRSLVMDFLAARKGKARGLDAGADFPDLWKNYVWNGGGNIGITFGHSNVFHTGTYEDKPKLMGQDVTSMNIDITVFTGISNVTHALTGRARLLYGKTWTTQVNELGEKVDVDTESADEAKFNLLYQLKSPKNSWFSGSWWAPIPFVDVGYTTEFTASLRDETYRAKLFTGVLGLGMEVWESRLFFKAGAGMRREYGEEDVKAQNTLYAGWQLNNGDLFKFLGQGVKGESRLDGYILDSEGQPLNYEIQLSNKLYFALNNRIFFSFTHEAYALKREGERWSFAMDFLFGFNVLFDVRVPFIVY